MPFRSKRQRRFAYAHPEKFGGKKGLKHWESVTPKGIPEKVGKAELPKRHKLGIGKPMGTAHYVHKDYADKVVPKDILSHAQGKLPKDFDYHIVKYDPKEGSVSFIQSHDFDTSDEPSVSDSIKVHRDGSTKYRKAPSRTQIYHHKWMFVPDEHKGFDVDQSKKRSLSWLGREDLDSKKIGWKDYWDKKMGKSEDPYSHGWKAYHGATWANGEPIHEDDNSNQANVVRNAKAIEAQLDKEGFDAFHFHPSSSSHYIEVTPQGGPKHTPLKIRVADHANTSRLHESPHINLVNPNSSDWKHVVDRVKRAKLVYNDETDEHQWHLPEPMGKSEPLAKAMKDFYKPEQMSQHKEHLDWAKTTLPNENWKEFFARNHSKSPESFTPEVKSHLEHFSGSTHLPEINKFRFDPKDTFEEGIKKLQGAEGQAQARLANSINIVKPTPETEKVLDNGDGTAWYDLNKPFCEAEGKAMGHCGNKPSAREGDHVLSLRKIHKIGGQEYHEPMLTFIENNGYLGEMKGRANNKPTAKTHKAIANLLMSPRIKQTVGGGYAHFSNFHVDDLSPELKGEVLRSKPNIDPYSSGLGEDAPEHFKKEVESVKKLRDSYKQKHGENWREALVKDLPSLSSDIALGEFPVLNALPNPTDEELLGFVNHPDSLQVFKIHSAMSAKNNAPHHRTLSRISPNSLEYLQNPNVEAILDGDYSDSKAQEAELLGHLSRNPSMSTSRAKKLAQHPRLNDYHIDRMTQNYGDNIEVAKALLDQPSHKFSDFYGGKNRLIRAHANNPENFQAILDHPNVHAYDLMKWFDADETQKKELPKEVLKQVVSHPKNADGALSRSFANSLANRSYVGERHLPLLHTIIDDPKADDAIVTNIAKAHARGVKDAISRKTDQSFRDRELEQKILDHPNASADTIAHIARLPNSDNDLRELIKHPKADAKTIHAAMAQGGKQNFEFLKELIGNKKVSPKTMELLSFSIGNHPEKADEIIDMILKHPKTSATALEALATKLSTYEGKKHRHRFKDILAHKKVGANAMKIINDSIYPRENEDDRETVKRLINHPKATPTVLDAVSDRHSYGTSIPEELKQILRERRQGIKKSEDLEKGSRQARIPFNPLSDFYAPSRNPQLLNIQTWQDEGAPERPSRDAIVKDTGNVRERFLHKLAGKTSVRRAKDGGVEYLLHRGETGARILPNPDTADTHVSHEDNTSWTPHFGKAYRFAYNTNTQKPDTLHSAWIHENDILTVPNQYGYIGNPYKGKNKWHTEHEVIVRPHHSEKAKYEHVFEDDVHPDLQERITRRGKGEKWKQSPKRLLSQRRELGKSEEDYRMAHRAPQSDSGAPLHDLTQMLPDDIYGPHAHRYYGHGGSPEDIEMDRQSASVLRQYKGKPEAMVPIYRAVPKIKTNAEKANLLDAQMSSYLKRGKMPKDSTHKSGSDWYDWAHGERERLRQTPDKGATNISKINAGDWVTLNRNYAKAHGERSLGGDYKILTTRVPAKHLFTNGDSIHEFGYDPVEKAIGKSEPLTKAPMVADAYKDVIRTHTFDPVEHNPEDSHDSEGVNYIGSTNFGGHRIHTFHENYMDGESFIHHVITDNGEHTGKPLSRVSIEQQIPDDYEDYGDETHHLTHAATHPDHRGKGMSYALHKFAIKDLNGKTLHSDIRLSPESHAVWKKLKRDPDLKVKLSRKLRDYDTAHTANWMGKSELAKGSRSKRFPFNPLQDINPNNPVHIHNFQEYDGDSDPDDLWGARNAIQPDHGNIRQRFLLGLHPQTEVRRAKDGKREFLLHRGVDSDAEFDEYSGNKIDKKKVSHAQNSSWTPHIGFAASRMATGQDKDLVSAWIHEDKIVTVPKQYGNLDRRWGEGKGKNDFANEHEVIVAPHTSELHQPTVTKSELAKALTPEEMKAQGYKFKILKPSKRREAYAVTAHHNGKKVGHLVFSKDPRMGSREDNAHEKGFHETYTGHIEPEHRGKGLYQQMLHIGAEHAKSLGGEGLMSSGYQRSGDATRAWDKVASFAQDPKNSTSIKPLPYRANYFLKKSDVKTLRQKRQGHYAKKILEGLKKIRKL